MLFGFADAERLLRGDDEAGEGKCPSFCKYPRSSRRMIVVIGRSSLAEAATKAAFTSEGIRKESVSPCRLAGFSALTIRIDLCCSVLTRMVLACMVLPRQPKAVTMDALAEHVSFPVAASLVRMSLKRGMRA